MGCGMFPRHNLFFHFIEKPHPKWFHYTMERILLKSPIRIRCTIQYYIPSIYYIKEKDIYDSDFILCVAQLVFSYAMLKIKIKNLLWVLRGRITRAMWMNGWFQYILNNIYYLHVKPFSFQSHKSLNKTKCISTN